MSVWEFDLAFSMSHQILELAFVERAVVIINITLAIFRLAGLPELGDASAIGQDEGAEALPFSEREGSVK